MEVTEKKILLSGIDLLKKSTLVSWSHGDIEDWADWAKRMKTTINTFIGMAKPLTENEIPDEEKKSDKLKDILP
ncbi:MAG: hypothetical protein PHF86_01710 [Candidatus Nanoarchaeia archaeon]|nr:hypothetical protein [Candidatus Nanoarchaeia archaeon]